LQKKAGKSPGLSAAAGKAGRTGARASGTGEPAGGVEASSDSAVSPPSPPPKGEEGDSGDSLSFEEQCDLAERSVELLERGNLPLEESLRQYERGLRALKSCYQILGSAEKRIEVLGEEVGAVAGSAWKPVGSDARLTEVAEAVDRENELPDA
jgi:exodeoxyribonuclease VII small subunit